MRFMRSKYFANKRTSWAQDMPSQTRTTESVERASAENYALAMGERTLKRSDLFRYILASIAQYEPSILDNVVSPLCCTPCISMYHALTPGLRFSARSECKSLDMMEDKRIPRDIPRRVVKTSTRQSWTWSIISWLLSERWLVHLRVIAYFDSWLQYAHDRLNR